ncbi:MAG: NPCBM/NEW2 domain-containing protein [Fibrobacterales bacterium]
MIVITSKGFTADHVEFITSVYHYMNPKKIDSFEKLRSKGIYPYMDVVDAESEITIKDSVNKPHVFVVMLESFSGFYTDRIENGKAVTPFVDSLKNHGLYIPEFYSTSVETSKGQFATLCSVYPSYRTNVFTSFYQNNYRCLSHIMKDNGYTNVFLKAYSNLGFENTGTFVLNNGFEHATGMDRRYVTKEEKKKYTIGWGIQDDLFYKKTFDILDSLKQEENKPLFVMTMSVTNHMMFRSIPKEQKYIYPKAKSNHENYTNSMHLTDKYLREFFKQLERRPEFDNSIVIVTGDNGFPMGQHKNNYHNTKTAYNEMFKMPLIVLWKDKVAPAVLNKTAYSQLDIAPTILDLLDIRTTNHFVGSSVFKRPEHGAFVPLVQPFDGTFLASIRYPFKLIHNLKSNKDELYNIADDPGEKINIFDDFEDIKLINQMREDLDVVRYNEVLLKENRIYTSDLGKNNFRIQIDTFKLEQGEDLEYRVEGNYGPKHRFTVMNHTVHPYSTMEQIDSLHLSPRSNLSIAAEFFKPGINDLEFKVYFGDEYLFTKWKSVYVESPNTTLITDLNITGKAGYKKYQINKSIREIDLKIDARLYDMGVGTHATSTNTIILDKDYGVFHTWYGMDDGAKCGDGALFEILGDGKRLFKSKKMKQNTVKHVSVPVTSVKKLELRTHVGNGGSCDHTDWLNPVLYTAVSKEEQSIYSSTFNSTKGNILSDSITLKVKSKSDVSFSVSILNVLTGKQKEITVKKDEVKTSVGELVKVGYNEISVSLYYQKILIDTQTHTIFRKGDGVKRLTTLKGSSTQTYKSLKINKSVDNHPLTVGDKKYTEGLGTHAPSELRYQLKSSYSTFEAVVGIDDEVSCSDGISFEVLGDGKSLSKSSIVKQGKTITIKTDISGVKKLALKSNSEGSSYCDHANWMNPLLIK